MKRYAIRTAVAVASFVLGTSLTAVWFNLGPHSELAHAPFESSDKGNTAPTSVPQPADAEESCFNLSKDDPARSKLNGWRLPIGNDQSLDYTIQETKVIPLSCGNLLAGVADTLTMYSPKRRVLWSKVVPQVLIDFDVVESRGLVYVTAGDNWMFILNLSSGKELLSNTRNGSAAYDEVMAYGKDQCLITDNYWAYREKFGDLDPPDWITAWKGTKILWHQKFPPDADLVVHGRKIFAVTKTKTSVYVKEIVPPKL